MPSVRDFTLLLTDIVGSTMWTHRLGDEASAMHSAEHDRTARELLARWNGREIDKSDGFLILFNRVSDAVGYARDYHDALARLEPPVEARAGIHHGALTLRENPPEHVSRGAKPLEVDGELKPVAARIMGTARPGQTLLSAHARETLSKEDRGRWKSFGSWRFKGIDEPVELYGARAPGSGTNSTYECPPDGDKSWRVVAQGDHWIPVRDLPHSLPAERDRFVGRTQLLQDIERHMDHGARLVSLLGVGGVGKTRLALHHGWRQLGDFPGGVWFCDLSPARSLDGALHAVAQGLRLGTLNREPTVQIGEALFGRDPCLVIVDNFEQVASHAEATVGKWLAAAPRSKFLVTTREVLGIPGEVIVDLPPLEAQDGAELLKHRASAAGISLSSQVDRVAIAELVRLLDGLPLAIELAASRMRVLSASQLVSRMGERFRLLAATRGRLDRQATLRATLDWSWDLLKDTERAAMTHLSVFEASFSLEAAEAVVDISTLDPTAWTTDLVQQLVDKSLVRKVGQERFELLHTVQEYFAERLAVDGPVDLQRSSPQSRHWTYYAGLDEKACMSDRCAASENLVVACRRATAAGALGSAAMALCGCWSALKLTGPFTVASGLAYALLERAPPESPWRAYALWVLGCALQQLGDTQSARVHFHEAAHGDDKALACRVECSLGELESTTGQFATAALHLASALSLARELGDSTMQCKSLNALGALQGDQSALIAARAHYEEGLAVARANEDVRWEGGILGNLGGLYHSLGEADSARACYETALRIAGDAGDMRWEGNTRSNLGLLHFEAGRLDDARSQFEIALSIAKHLGHARLLGNVECNLGLLDESTENLDSAKVHLSCAVEAAHRLEDRRAESWFRCYLARLLLRVEDVTNARECLDRSEALLQDVPDDLISGLCRCVRAQLAATLGQTAEAQAALTLAQRSLARSGAGLQSELAREIARVSKLVPAAPASHD